MGDKDKLIIAMFLATSLTLSSGCGNLASHVHVDANGDGYCDDCKESMNRRSGIGTVFSRVMNSGTSSSGGHISTATVAHGGIGSHGSGGGG